MPPPRSKTVSVPVPQGNKKTFDDDDDDIEVDFNTASSSSGPSRQRTQSYKSQPDSDDASDSDDAPEAVGMSVGKRDALRDLEEANKLAQAKKNAAKLRNQKIAEARQKDMEAVKNGKARASKGKKRKNESDDEDEHEDAETRRLRARMEKAMDDGAGGSELDDESGDDLEGGSDDDDMDSFHTDTDDEDEEGTDEQDDEDVQGDFGEDDEDEEDASDDESETLEEGPIDNATRLMRERMQAAMEAAERRAGIVHPAKPAKSTKAAKTAAADDSVSAKSGPNSEVVAPPVTDDVTAWDMSAGVGGPQPLSAEVLRRAEEEAQESRRQKKEKARIAEEKRKAEEKGTSRTKRRKVVEATSRNLGNGRVAKLLQPTLDPSAAGLPPVVDAGRKHKGQAAGQASQKKFMKHAMKSSGQIPTKAAIDARRKPVGLERRY